MNVYYDRKRNIWMTMNGRPCILAAGDHVEISVCDAGFLNAIPQGLKMNSRNILEGSTIKVIGDPTPVEDDGGENE